MSDIFCNVCDKTIERRYKNKPLKTKSHEENIKYILTKYTIKNPNLPELDAVLKQHVNDIDNKIRLYSINCHFKLVFEHFILFSQ